MVFSDRIAKLRKENGLNQMDLAEGLRVSVDSVRRWEQGKRSPDVEMMNKIAQLLNTTVGYLSGETDNPERKLDDSSIDSSFIQKGDFIGSGKVLFYRDGDKQFVLPATPEAQTWFQKFIENLMLNRAEVHAS